MRPRGPYGRSTSLYFRCLEILGYRARPLPAPPRIVFQSLAEPKGPGTSPWVVLLEDERPPIVLQAEESHHVRWSSLWPSRPNDVLDFEISPKDGGSILRFILSTPDESPDASRLGHMRKRLNHLLFADRRFSYGQ